MEKFDRRTVLTGMLATAAGLEVSGAPAPATSQAPTHSVKAPAFVEGLPDFVVVGAGAFGVWTALSLREKGAKVTLVDAYGPGNPLCSSSGDTRELRKGYGADEIYTIWAMKALEKSIRGACRCEQRAHFDCGLGNRLANRRSRNQRNPRNYKDLDWRSGRDSNPRPPA